MQLQSADLPAYFLRSHEALRLHGESSERKELVAKLLPVEPDDRIVFKGGTWVLPETVTAFLRLGNKTISA